MRLDLLANVKCEPFEIDGETFDSESVFALGLTADCTGVVAAHADGRLTVECISDVSFDFGASTQQVLEQADRARLRRRGMVRASRRMGAR